VPTAALYAPRIYVLDPAASESWVPFSQLGQLYEADPISIMMQY
jgi:hypothetical protein